MPLPSGGRLPVAVDIGRVTSFAAQSLSVRRRQWTGRRGVPGGAFCRLSRGGEDPSGKGSGEPRDVPGRIRTGLNGPSATGGVLGNRSWPDRRRGSWPPPKVAHSSPAWTWPLAGRWCGLRGGSGGWQSFEHVEDELGFLVGGLLGEVGVASEPFVDLIGGVRGASVGPEVDKHQGSRFGLILVSTGP